MWYLRVKFQKQRPHKKAFFSWGHVSLDGSCWSLWPYSDSVFMTEGLWRSPNHKSIVPPPGRPPEVLGLGSVEVAPQPDPAVGMHSAAGRLHSASTVPRSPCQPPGPAGKTKEKLFPCCLATIGKPSSGSKGEQRGRQQTEEEEKKTDLERIFCCNFPN